MEPPGWGEGVAPLALGGTVPDALGPGNWLTIAIANLVVIAVIAATIRRSRGTALTWAGALIVVLGGLVMSGKARLAQEGVEPVALDLRYNAEGVVALLIAAGLAGRAAWPSLSLGAGRVAAAIACLLAVTFAVDAGLRLRGDWIGPSHRRYFGEFATTLDGQPDVDIVDTVSPNSIVPVVITPWNLLSEVLPAREPDVKVGTGQGPPATIDPDGRVHRVALRPVKAVPAGCAPATLDVSATGAEDVVVLTFRRPAPYPAINTTLVADSGVPGGPIVRGFQFPQTSNVPLRLKAGQAAKRIAVGIGPVKALTVAADVSGPLCLTDARLDRYPFGG